MIVRDKFNEDKHILHYSQKQNFDFISSQAMGCSGSKQVVTKKVKTPAPGRTNERKSSSLSNDTNDRKEKNDRFNTEGSQSCSDYDGDLSDEELDQLEREQRELVWLEKAHLRNRVRAENMMDGDYILPTTNERSALDLLKQEEEMAILNQDALKKQKQKRRRKLKRKAEREQKWMVFSDMDCFDESDMIKLSDFLSVIMKAVPTSNNKCNQHSTRGGNSSTTCNNSDSNSDRAEAYNCDTRCIHRTGNVVADYLASKDDKSTEKIPQSQRSIPVDSIADNVTSCCKDSISEDEEHSTYLSGNLTVNTGSDLDMQSQMI